MNLSVEIRYHKKKKKKKKVGNAVLQYYHNINELFLLHLVFEPFSLLQQNSQLLHRSVI